MNRVQNTKARDLQKPVSGCMGRMISMFDLNTGMTRSKLLTEQAHRDVGNSIRRDQPDMAKATDTIGVRLENRPIYSGRSSSKRLDGTPVKVLLAQEMAKETESKQMPPNVVARLMGLDAVPTHSSVSNGRSSSLENSCFDSPMPHEEYKDVYEVLKRPSEANLIKDQSSQKGRCNASLTAKRLAIVRQKFIEAKTLSTDGNVDQSKELRDALEILSSNRDFFLKFFDEPNSLPSKHVSELQAQTRRITVLKPARTVESDDSEHLPNLLCQSAESSGLEMNKLRIAHQKAENTSRPTKIVVLKPHDIKNTTVGFHPPELLVGQDVCSDKGSRKLAKGITRQMRDILNSNQRNEVFLSSVLSNVYTKNHSSLSRSEDDDCDSSDSEIETPTSRNSWDCINRSDDPRSISSCASISSESSVVREAKKRLSERWESTESNGIGQGPRQERSSNTLGEMLGILDVKKDEGSGESKSVDSHRNLSRSNSVPSSSLNYINSGLKKEVHDSERSSFKGKVSNMFFSKIKKSGRDKSAPHLVSSDLQSGSVARNDDTSRSDHASCPEGSGRLNHQEASSYSTSLTKTRDKEDSSVHISVVEPQFEDGSSLIINGSCISGNPQALGRSRPIESLARSTRSTTSLYVPSKHCRSDLHEAAYEEREQSVFIQKLLSCSSLGDADDSSAVFSRWHSVDSPLDPILLDQEEAKLRMRRSNQKLLFDFVNSALLDIGRGKLTRVYPWVQSFSGARNGGPGSLNVVREVLRNWSSGEGEWESVGAKNGGALVDRMVKMEGWAEMIWPEIEEFGGEISGNVLDELVEEALTELTSELS